MNAVRPIAASTTTTGTRMLRTCGGAVRAVVLQAQKGPPRRETACRTLHAGMMHHRLLDPRRRTTTMPRCNLRTLCASSRNDKFGGGNGPPQPEQTNESRMRRTTASIEDTTAVIGQSDKENLNQEEANVVRSSSSSSSRTSKRPNIPFRKLTGESLQAPAGCLWNESSFGGTDDDGGGSDRQFIPQVSLHASDGRGKKRVLVLCTGGTLTMAPDERGALAPVQGAISQYMQNMHELQADHMPDLVLHEYTPFLDSSDLGPAEFANIAHDIRANYLHFDGFVVLSGTDTMAYCATALSFMLENLGKPVVFTGSQIPLCEPYNDGRHNLIMALIFASRDTINEVTIFFHDRLLRACRATKVNTHRLLAFDSPNLDPLATIGIAIDENEALVLPPAKGALRVHTRMDTRLLTIRLVPGFDDAVIAEMIERNAERKLLKALVLQLYGTGNLPSVKESFIQLLADASSRGILVVAATQCFTGSVLLGHYAVGQALESAGVVSANDMTLEATACKIAYLFGRGDLNHAEVAALMGVSLRGEITPLEALSPPPLSSDYQRRIQKGNRFY